MTKDTQMFLGVLGVLISIGLAFWSEGYSERTATPPLVNLTLSKPGCEYVARSGISSAVRDGICTIEVRYRKFRLSDGGTIEQSGLSRIEISSGPVVGLTQIDDGSNEPWPAEHKKAAVYLVGSFMLQLFFLWILVRSAKKGRKQS
jgi:hypothetical protein